MTYRHLASASCISPHAEHGTLKFGGTTLALFWLAVSLPRGSPPSCWALGRILSWSVLVRVAPAEGGDAVRILFGRRDEVQGVEVAAKGEVAVVVLVLVRINGPTGRGLSRRWLSASLSLALFVPLRSGELPGIWAVGEIVAVELADGVAEVPAVDELADEVLPMMVFVPAPSPPPPW